MKKTAFIIFLFLVFLVTVFFYFRNQIYYSRGENSEKISFVVEKGEGALQVAEKLSEAKLVSGKMYFYYYLKSSGLLDKLLPGEYSLAQNLSIPEIAIILTQEEKNSIKITFPEGWNAKQMAERISANDLDGNGFLKLVSDPTTEILNEAPILAESGVKNLEGYLFPDTYFFTKETDALGIVKKMLRNFDNRFSKELRAEIIKQNKELPEIIIMASLIEKEVRNAEDREIVSGIFWSRIKVGQALGSCATLAYILGENKKQYSYADTQIVSPYNTYLNSGLPPGPIANPGLAAIFASIYPKDSNYNYFLSDPETGKTIFSKDLDEHNANKVKYGL